MNSGQTRELFRPLNGSRFFLKCVSVTMGDRQSVFCKAIRAQTALFEDEPIDRGLCDCTSASKLGIDVDAKINCQVNEMIRLK